MYNLLLNIPLAQTLRKIVPFFWPAPCKILDVTAGKKLVWKQFLGINNGETLFNKKLEGYDVTFMDLAPQASDIIQAHAWELPFKKRAFNVVFCDFPFTPSLLDDRLRDIRVQAHYSRDPRAFYQNSDLNLEDSTSRSGGKSSMAFLRDGRKMVGVPKTTTNEKTYMLKAADDNAKWSNPNPLMQGTNALERKMQTKVERASLYLGPAYSKSKDPIKRFKHANMTTGSHLSNNFVPPMENFRKTWREFNRVSMDGLIVKIGEYHKDWHYYPGDFEAALNYDNRWNHKSEFEWVARVFYKGIRPMVHQVPHPQPILTFYCVFKKDIKARGATPRRNRRKVSEKS